MKTPKQLLLSIAIGLLSLTAIGCGSSGGSSSNTTAATPSNAYGACGTTGYGASCGANMIQSQYGCLPQCSTGAVYYNGQCVPVTTATSAYGCNSQTGYGYGYGNTAMCSGSCPQGYVSINGGTSCQPQGSCGPCYAQLGNYCYIGDYAHQYYGY